MQKERQIGETEDEKNEELDFETLNEKDTILPLFIDDKMPTIRRVNLIMIHVNFFDNMTYGYQ